MTLRIAMWSGPRNISTAMMRAFENRPDTSVVDEPLYGFYLRATGLEHPMGEAVMASQSARWQDVADQLTGPVPGGHEVWYQKHMAHHLLPEVGLGWLGGLRHAFLVRDPAAVAVSYHRARPNPTLEDLGYPQQVALLRYTRDTLGQAPVVLDTDAILAHPEAALSGLCAGLGIAFDRSMLAWPAGPRASDGVWAPHWYASVERSTGFERRERADVVVPPELADVVAAAEPLYRELLAAQ